MTTKSKKRRLKRAREHQANAKTKARFYNALEAAGTKTGRFSSVSTKPLRELGFSLDGPFSGFTSMRGPDLVIADEPIVDNLSEMQVLGNSVTGQVEIPSRSKCPQCGFSQKVRKDGTMSRHDVFIGETAAQCGGTGKKWNSG